MEENEDAIAEALAKDMHKVWPLWNTVNPLLSPPFQRKKINKPPLSIKLPSPPLIILH